MHEFIKPYSILPNVWDEMFQDKMIRPHYRALYNYLESLPLSNIKNKEILSEKLFMTNGITFTVYSSKEGIEKVFPFDIIPRIINATEWALIDKGIKQRILALNKFLHDIYHQQEIIKEGIIPAYTIYSCPYFLREMIGVDLPFNLYIHIAGIDLVRAEDGEYYVLEDNLRTPSGVSYMIENRDVSKRIFPEILGMEKVRGVYDYTNILYKNLAALSPRYISDPTIVLLTPGVFNSAFYEHSFLARYMGIELVQGTDLVVDNNIVYMKTTNGFKQVDVIYKRVDDEFIDPLVFKSDSMLGVPGLISAYRKGNVVLVNAIGNGVADDKAIYSYVPKMIEYYLNEKPILKNVPTYQLSIPDEREYAFANIRNMVLKKTNESGGYGMLMGNNSTEKEIALYKLDILKNPRSFIAQPIINISATPCFINNKLQPRRIDLRPFALVGPNSIELVPGGLTRVALKENSLIVNSSQGGGSKDTWVLDE